MNKNKGCVSIAELEREEEEEKKNRRGNKKRKRLRGVNAMRASHKIVANIQSGFY